MWDMLVVYLDDGCIARFVNSDAFGHALVLLYVYVGGSGGGWSSLLSAWRRAFKSRICCESVWKFVFLDVVLDKVDGLTVDVLLAIRRAVGDPRKIDEGQSGPEGAKNLEVDWRGADVGALARDLFCEPLDLRRNTVDFDLLATRGGIEVPADDGVRFHLRNGC